jgi:hypothetical protein
MYCKPSSSSASRKGSPLPLAASGKYMSLSDGWGVFSNEPLLHRRLFATVVCMKVQCLHQSIERHKNEFSLLVRDANCKQVKRVLDGIENELVVGYTVDCAAHKGELHQTCILIESSP